MTYTKHRYSLSYKCVLQIIASLIRLEKLGTTIEPNALLLIIMNDWKVVLYDIHSDMAC